MGRKPKNNRPPDHRESGPNPPAPATYKAAAVGAALLLAIFLVFGQTLRHGFVNYDDPLYVQENPHVTQGLTAEGIGWAFTTCHGSLWGPLTWLSHLADCQFHGLNAGGHHLTNVLLHAASTILLFLVLWRMTGDLWPSAFVAAVFAIHPLQAESVAWVAERKGLLSGLFFMLTLAAYVGYVRHAFSMVRYLTVVAVFALGLMAKPVLVTLPFLLLLLDYWPLGRLSSPEADGQDKQRSFPWRFVVEKLPLLALAAAACVATPLAQGSAVVSLDVIPLSVRISNALVSYVAYVEKLFCPTGLAVFYPHPGTSLPIGEAAGAFVALAVVSVGVFWGRRKFPYLFVGWFWYLGMFVPMIGLVQIGTHAMANRYMYLPQIGLCIALAWGVAETLATWPRWRWACGIITALVLFGLINFAWQQTSYWRDSKTLWNHALACTSRNATAHNNLGLALADRKETDKAIAQYREALKINPNFTDAHNNFGVALAGRGQTDKAIAHFQRALTVNSNLEKTHYNLGNALARRGELDEAVAHYRRALEINPGLVGAYCSLGSVLARQGDLVEAADCLQKALKIKPDHADVRYNLGVILDRQGHVADAMIQWREAVRRQPNDTGVLDQLAWKLATCPDASIRNGAEAVDLAERAARLSSGREPSILGTLAAAYAEAGKFPEAVKTAETAASLASKRGDTALAGALRTQIRSYRSGSPYHEAQP